MGRYKNEMVTKIYAHEIAYSWEDGEKRELDECDIDYIKELLKEDYIEGELCQYNNETDEEFRGWWRIKR